jgi:hypothetical protein
LCDAAIDDQVMTVVHEHMASVAQLRWMGLGFAGQQSLGIAAGAVGLVAELDAAKVTLGPLPSLLGGTESLARTCGRRRRILLTIDPLQGGVRRPGLQQRAVHGEVVVTEERFDLGSTHQLLQEQPHDVVIEQPIAVLGERGRVPDRIIRAEAHKPAEQQVVVELLQQQPLGSDPVKRLQQRGQQQLLRRNRWSSFQGIQPAEGWIEPIKRLIRQLANPPERMAARDPILNRDVGEQGAAALLLASHQRMGS